MNASDSSHITLQLNALGTMPLRLHLEPIADTDNFSLSAQLNIPRHYHRLVRKNMRDMLRLKIGAKEMRFTGNEAGDELQCQLELSASEILGMPIHCSIKQKSFQSAWVDAQGGLSEDAHNAIKRLDATDLRAFSEQRIDEFPYERSKLDSFDPKQHAPLTDLHTHLTSQIYARDLIRIAIAQRALYPIELLLKIDGIREADLPAARQRMKSIEFKPMGDYALRCEKLNPQTGKAYEDIEAICLADASPQVLEKLEAHLQLAEDRKKTFGQLEREMYRFRNPLTKNDALIEPIILKVAEDYQQQGVRYTEQAVTGAMNPGWLAKALPALEKAKADYGVDIRLLVGIPREMSARDMLDAVEKIKLVAHHPAIAGVDFLGFEANKSEYFEFAMRRIAEWVSKRKAQGRDDFVIRVHAGENSKNAENVTHAMRIAKEYGIKLRIGHGVHFNADKEMQSLARDLVARNLIALECNPASNMALVNIDLLSEIPAKQWSKLGVPIVIGSDGAGAYQVGSRQNAIQMLHAGLSLSDLEAIRRWEENYISQQAQHYRTKTEDFAQRYPKGESAFLSEYQAVSQMLSANNLSRKLHPSLAQKKPVLIAGASGSSWSLMSPKSQLESEIGIAMLTELLDFDQCYLAVGRIKDEGVTRCVDKTLSSLNDKTGVELVGIMASRQGQAMRMPLNITQIFPLSGELMNIPEEMVRFLSTYGGCALYIGGSGLTRDFIHLSKESEIPFGLMRDAEGASQQRARVTDPNQHVFEGAIGMVRHVQKMQQQSIDQGEKPLLRADADLSDAALQRMYDRIKSEKEAALRRERHNRSGAAGKAM